MFFLYDLRNINNDNLVKRGCRGNLNYIFVIFLILIGFEFWILLYYRLLFVCV